jgi:hypothetical protein
MFPLGIPKTVYPLGCGDFGFTPKQGFEDTAQSWIELDRKAGLASLWDGWESDFPSPAPSKASPG